MLEAIYSNSRRLAAASAAAARSKPASHDVGGKLKQGSKLQADVNKTLATPPAAESTHATIEVAPGVEVGLSKMRPVHIGVRREHHAEPPQLGAPSYQSSKPVRGGKRQAALGANSSAYSTSSSSDLSIKNGSSLQAKNSSAAGGVVQPTPRTAWSPTRRLAAGMIPPSPVSVRELFEAAVQAVTTHHLQELRSVTAKANCLVINSALPALGRDKRLREVEAVLQVARELGMMNTHSHAMVMWAYHEAGRFDLALQYFEDSCRSSVDIGPAGASMLLKLCAQRRDLDLALDCFHKMTGRTTFNRFAYNCLMHLAGVMGRINDAIVVLQMMREDSAPETRPDCYTYSALLRAICQSKAYNMLSQVYAEMQRDRISPDPEVWSMYIIAAGRANRPDLAMTFFNACIASGCMPNQQIYNSLLCSQARVLDLDEVLALYRRMLSDGMAPDEYTFNAILTAMGRIGASLYAVEDLVGEMARWGVQTNTYLGTSLINAYKRVPEMAYRDPRTTSMLLEKAHDVLGKLEVSRQANSQTYASLMAMHAQLGDMTGVQQLLRRMHEAGVQPDAMMYHALARACEEGGLVQQAQKFKEQAGALEARGRGLSKAQKLKGMFRATGGKKKGSSSSIKSLRAAW